MIVELNLLSVAFFSAGCLAFCYAAFKAGKASAYRSVHKSISEAVSEIARSRSTTPPPNYD